jgi:hypothetical protein
LERLLCKILKIDTKMSTLRIKSGQSIVLKTPIGMSVDISTNENGEMVVTVEKEREKERPSTPLRIEIPENISEIEGSDMSNMLSVSSGDMTLLPMNLLHDYVAIRNGVSEMDTDSPPDSIVGEQLRKQKILRFHHYRSMSFEYDNDSYPHIKKTLQTSIKNQFEVETTVSHSPYGYSAESRPILTGLHIVVLGNYFAGTTMQKNTLEKILTIFGARLIKHVQPHADLVIVGFCGYHYATETQHVTAYNIPEIHHVGTFLSCMYEFALKYASETQHRIQLLKQQTPTPPVPLPFSFPFPAPAPSGVQFHMGVNYKQLSGLSRSKQGREIERYNLSEESKQIVQNKLSTLTSSKK